MTYEEFAAFARETFDAVPDDFKEGVDGLEVTRRTVPHPSLPEVFTLGECVSDFYPTEFGGAGEIRSRVVLYYGSFLALSRTHEDWDWEGEVWETITHEIRHHLEHLALEDALEERDYADDQNFARREGEAFDPLFFRWGEPLDDDTFEVDGDIFVEREIRGRDGGEELELRVADRLVRVRLPESPADIHYLKLNPSWRRQDEGGELFLVLVRRRGFLDVTRDLLGSRQPSFQETKAEAREVAAATLPGRGDLR